MMSASSQNKQPTDNRGGTEKESTPVNNVSNMVKAQEAIAGTAAETGPSKPVQRNKCVLFFLIHVSKKILINGIRVVTHLPLDKMGNRMKKELERKSNLDKKNYFWGMTGATLKKATKAERLELNAQL